MIDASPKNKYDSKATLVSLLEGICGHKPLILNLDELNSMKDKIRFK